MHRRQLEISMNRLLKMWQIKTLYVDGSTSSALVTLFQFRSGDFPLENKPRGRHETKVGNDKLETVVEADTAQARRELAVPLDVSIATVLGHLKETGQGKEAGKLGITQTERTLNDTLS